MMIKDIHRLTLVIEMIRDIHRFDPHARNDPFIFCSRKGLGTWLVNSGIPVSRLQRSVKYRDGDF